MQSFVSSCFSSSSASTQRRFVCMDPSALHPRTNARTMCNLSLLHYCIGKILFQRRIDALWLCLGISIQVEVTSVLLTETVAVHNPGSVRLLVKALVLIYTADLLGEKNIVSWLISRLITTAEHFLSCKLQCRAHRFPIYDAFTSFFIFTFTRKIDPIGH